MHKPTGNMVNKLVTCPYDKAHRVKESRFQLHVAQCKSAHLSLEKRVCPFNATHLLAKGEYDHHLLNCPERAPLDRQIAQNINKNNPYKGRTDVPDYSDPICDEESWDAVDEITTQQISAPPPGAIIEPPAMSKPAERKRLYRELHQCPTEKIDVTLQPPKPAPAQARQPKQPSAHMVQQQFMDNVGLGRGKPTSRIAAVFPKASVEAPQVPSYSSMLCKDMSNLGLGRGTSVRPAPAHLGNNNNDEDFPALGSGRGSLRKPKQNSSQNAWCVKP